MNEIACNRVSIKLFIKRLIARRDSSARCWCEAVVSEIARNRGVSRGCNKRMMARRESSTWHWWGVAVNEIACARVWNRDFKELKKKV